jgi:four helix bundle protein
MQDSRNLRVAAPAQAQALGGYRPTAVFPPDERFGVTPQMRRSAVSIASNIAEGCGRCSNRGLLAFLYIAAGSASELACQLAIASSLGFGNAESSDSLRQEITYVSRMLTKLIGYLRAQPIRRTEREAVN